MFVEDDPAYAVRRTEMVASQLRARGIRDERVLDAMLRIPRHLFVSPQLRSAAYEDRPLPIGEGQTISQPFIVAVSLQALQLTPDNSVLEIGTGSGYQTALLSLLSKQVYSVEVRPELAAQAAAVLSQLQLDNVHIKVGDGSEGWPEKSPFDAIVVSAATPSIPQPLIEQLANSGRLVLPVGPPESQRLELVRKNQSSISTEYIEGCRFVPLIGAAGY